MDASAFAKKTIRRSASPKPSNREPVLVNTKNGAVVGRRRLTADRIEFVSFQGIPYAQPPVGDLRFKAPVPVRNWSAPLDATKLAAVPNALDYHTKQFDERSSEDCLHLNIYTRNSRPSQLRPVMLYIHGGGFTVGSPDEIMYSPQFLLRDDVVFVSIAYRLGALGFLSVADPAVGVPGNAGLKDQALAMRWVRDNIAAFGGDAGNVTLFGESAGAASVHYHMMSERSRGLFHRAILQSGTALCPWAQQPRRDLGAQLARKLGWSGAGGAAGMMAVLRRADAREITLAQQLEDSADHQRGHYFAFVPVVEPYGAGTAECFLPQAPELLAANAWGNSIPMMLGCVADECMFFYAAWKRHPEVLGDFGNFVNMLPPNLSDVGEERRTELATRLKRAYFGDAEPTVENLRTFAAMQNDFLFGSAVMDTIRWRQAAGNLAPTFLYRFAYDSPRDGFAAMKMMTCGEQLKAVLHGEELMYLFRMAFVEYEGDEELRMVENMVSIWTTFAANGDPNNAKLGVKWLAVEGEGRQPKGFRCLNIAEKMEFVELPETKSMAVWDGLKETV